MQYFVEVVIPLALEPTFTYEVSAQEFAFIQVGMRVAVPFGKTKVYTGLVLEKHHHAPQLYEAKEINEILDLTPVVTVKQLLLWKWIAEYYLCTIGEVYRAAMPSRLLLESETLVQFNPETTVEVDSLDDAEYLLYEALQQQAILKIEEIIAILNQKKIFPVIHSLIEKNIIFLQEEMVEKYKPKEVKYITLVEEFLAENALAELLTLVNRSEKQRMLIMSYFQLNAVAKGPITAKELLSKAECTAAVLKALVDKGILKEYYLSQDRVVFGDATQDIIALSPAQKQALDEVEIILAQDKVALLHGVTASGKTEIYIKLIEEALSRGGQVLFMVPEIGVSTQIVERLTRYFGNQVAVYHSRYSHNERLEVWSQVLSASSKAKVVIGTRLAIFLPFQRLDLIIVDEEHEGNYKQHEPAPRYHGRDCAIVIGKQFASKIIMGSATPSLESYYNAQQGKYGLVELSTRYSEVLLPDVELVDIKEQYKRKRMKGHFSTHLIEEINRALSLEEQVILFQNRRGFSPIVECSTCGAVPECPHCDVSLTYHKFKNELRCHYCGYGLQMPKQCVRCHSVDLNTKGFGTEQVEEELKELFPQAKTGRMDQDTTRGKYGYEKLVERFRNREIQILVGTQMLVKGFDFENVNLVGIMNADNSLYHPDFRAHERAYQLMVQFSGRAGRYDKRGKVIIQTFNPHHNIIQQVTNNDYLGMFKEQMYERYNFKYPPFYRLIRLSLRHRDFEKLKEASLWLCNSLRMKLDMPILGPEEPAINRIRNQYIRMVLIKIPQEKSLKDTKGEIRRILKTFEAIGAYRSVRVTINVDFY